MGRDWFDDDDGWSPYGDDGCIECGAVQYRESRVPGVCAACLNGEHDDNDLDYGYDDGWSESDDFISYGSSLV